MKGEILLEVLELLENAAYNTRDFVEAYLSSSKSNYLPLHRFEAKKYKSKLREIAEKHIKNRKAKQRLYAVIYKMKASGLIQKSRKELGVSWLVTQKGQEKKELLKSRLAKQAAYEKYPKEASREVIIVSFDIPEKLRGKRNWLRSILKNLGFRILQKSVWIGKIKIPEEFLTDLQKINILEYVEIFAVSKSGTIKQLT